MHPLARNRLHLACWLLLQLCLLLVVPVVTAERLPIKVYTTSEGLPSDSILCIVQDSRGFLWFCTVEGWARFNGYEFIRYSEQGGPRFVSHLLETRNGIYLLATAEGICRFKPDSRDARQRFETFRAPNAASQPRFLVEDRAGVIWCATTGGLYRLESIQGQLSYTFVRLDEGATQAAKLDVRHILEDRHGALWISTTTGLYHRTLDGRTERIDIPAGLLGPRAHQTVEDHAGRIWVATEAGLCQLAVMPDGQHTSVARVYTVKDGLAHDAVFTLLQTSAGSVYAGTARGLSELLPTAKPGEFSFRNYSVAQGLSDTSIVAMREDHNGNLWLGTDRGGVNEIAANGLTTFDRADGLAEERVVNLIKDRAGRLCPLGFATRTPVFQQFADRKFTATTPDLPKGVTRFVYGMSQTLLQDHLGEWWLASADGLVRYPKTDGITQLARVRPRAIYTTQDGLSGNNIFTCFEDLRGDLWIGSLNLNPPPNAATETNSLTRWERASGLFQQYTKKDGIRGFPTVFGEDAAGNVWIGFNGRLARYRQGQFTFFTVADGVPAGNVRSLYVDRANRVWLGTVNGGVARIEDTAAAHPRFTTYTTAQGLASNHVTCITEDQWGRIYFGTFDRGVDRFDPATNQFRRYTTADGLANNHINAVARDDEGALWFATNQGLTRLMPQPDHKDAPLLAVIGGLRVAGVAQNLPDLGATEINVPELSANQNQIQIDYFGLGAAFGEALRYQYKLEGARADWSEPATQRAINYANLAPGSYRVLVRALSADGARLSPPAVVTFRIAPPLWRRWWFITLVALTVLAGLVAFERYRAARLQELNAALTESQKLTGELRGQRAELQQANRTLELEYLITRILAESATPVEAAPRILEAICASTGWEIGAIWNVDPQSQVLHCLDFRGPRGKATLEFEALTRERVFAPGEGLPGRVWQNAAPLWITELEQDPNFPRFETAHKENLRSAFGFPVLLRGEVIGVLEFFNRERCEPDAEMMKMMSAIGSHIGQLIERKRAEESLRESETRFRTLAKTASDAIITIDAAGKIVFVNPATENVFGHSTAEMLGQDLTMLMPEYMRRLHQAGFTRYQATGQRHISWRAVELPGLHRDGHEIPLELSFGEFTNQGKRYFTGIIRDITERKLAAEALQQSREERLRELERVRRRIATDLHDDIGSSLTQISILSEVLRQRLGASQAAVAEPLDLIADASRELVDSMSDIVWAINPQKDRLSDLLQRMRRFAADSFTARQIQCELSLPGDGSGLAQEADLPLGANLRREVFLIYKESVNNVLRHSGCTAARITLQCSAHHLRLEVQDNGRGFAVTYESDGHGLLSMRDRAQDIGGELQIVSQPGVGTTVTLLIQIEPRSLTGRLRDLAT